MGSPPGDFAGDLAGDLAGELFGGGVDLAGEVLVEFIGGVFGGGGLLSGGGKGGCSVGFGSGVGSVCAFHLVLLFFVFLHSAAPVRVGVSAATGKNIFPVNDWISSSDPGTRSESVTSTALGRVRLKVESQLSFQSLPS